MEKQHKSRPHIIGTREPCSDQQLNLYPPFSRQEITTQFTGILPHKKGKPWLSLEKELRLVLKGDMSVQSESSAI